MRTLEELINATDSAIFLISEWAEKSAHPVEILPPSTERGRVLMDLQVTTRSSMGAIAYETGGLLIDKGWLRFLGSGHAKLLRNIVDWNKERSSGFLLVADDVVGGFFAINSGELGVDKGAMYYWAPDTLAWEPLGTGYSDFVNWSFSEKLQQFYQNLRWEGWESDLMDIGGDQCFNFYPYLWTKEGSVLKSSRKAISVAEQFSFNCDMALQINGRQS